MMPGLAEDFPQLLQALSRCGGMQEAAELRDRLKAGLFPQDALEPGVASRIPPLLDVVRSMRKDLRFFVFQVIEDALHLALPEEDAWGFTPIRRRFRPIPPAIPPQRGDMAALLPAVVKSARESLDCDDLGSAASLSRLLLLEPRGEDPAPILEAASCAGGGPPCSAVVTLARMALGPVAPPLQEGNDFGPFLSRLASVLAAPEPGTVTALAEVGLALDRADVDRMPWAEGAWLGIAAEWIRKVAQGREADILAALSGLFLHSAQQHGDEDEEDVFYEWSIPSLIGHQLALVAFPGNENRTHFLQREEFTETQMQVLRLFARFPSIEIAVLRNRGVFDYHHPRYMASAPPGPADDLFAGDFRGRPRAWPAWKWVWMAVEWDRYQGTFPRGTREILAQLRSGKGEEWFQAFTRDAAGGAFNLQQFRNLFGIP